jgi:hypothetical protein
MRTDPIPDEPFEPDPKFEPMDLPIRFPIQEPMNEPRE